MTAFASKLYAAEITYTAPFSLERAPSDDTDVKKDCGILPLCGALILEDDLSAEATFTLPQFDPTLGTLTSMYLDFSSEFVVGVRVTVQDNDPITANGVGASAILTSGGDPSQLRFILDGFDLFDPAGFFGTPIPGRPADFDLYYLYEMCQTPGGFGNAGTCSAVNSVADAFVGERLMAASGSFLSPLLIGTGSLTGSVAQLGEAIYACDQCDNNYPQDPAILFRAALLQNVGEISITYTYVPLPSSAWLLGTGIAAVVARRRRRP